MEVPTKTDHLSRVVLHSSGKIWGFCEISYRVYVQEGDYAELVHMMRRKGKIEVEEGS